MPASFSRIPRGEGQHLFSFVLLIFGFTLLTSFQALFDAAKWLLGDIDGMEAGIRFIHLFGDPFELPLIVPALDATLLAGTVIITLVQYYVIINRLALVYEVVYGLREFGLDMAAAMFFFFSASALKTGRGASFLATDKYWVLLGALYSVLTVRMVLAAVRISRKSAGAIPENRRAMTLAVAGIGCYWTTAIMMLWGLACARLGVSIKTIAHLELVGTSAVFSGVAIVAAMAMMQRTWRALIRIDLTTMLPMLVAVAAPIMTFAARRQQAGLLRLLLHDRFAFPWSLLPLAMMMCFLMTIVVTHSTVGDEADQATAPAMRRES